MMKNSGRLIYPDLPDEKEYPSQLLERCELLECFSHSEEMETLLARDRSSGEMYVVKCFRVSGPFYDREEPRTLRDLKEPPFPRFIAEYRNSEMRCVLREYVEGETLAEYAKGRIFTEEEIAGIGIQLCDELSVLHRKNPPVIHRDIKPQNVVMRPDGQAVLIDFGISRVRSDNETDTVAFGTQGFAPPEQYGFAQTDERSDLYSLGILLNWLLTREASPPKRTETPLQKVLARCTEFDPQKRYVNAQQMKKALQMTDPSLRRRRSIMRGIGCACAVCLIAALTIFLAGNRVKTVSFTEPLLESAVRLNLGLDESAKLTEDMLASVTGVYIVADAAYPDPDTFYPAINQWYADGKPVRGKMQNLDELPQLTGLEEVCIVAQELEDISGIAQLKELKKAEFKHNYITDISVFSGMERVTYVGINDNPVTDISPLAGCPNLAFLDLCDVRTYDPEEIAQLGNFDYLDISNPTESYNYLSGKRILALKLGWTGLTDLHVLDQVTGLGELDISHTAVTDLQPLAVHTGLKTLNIASLPAKDLSVLSQLPQLENVTVSEDMRPMAEALGDTAFTLNIQ